MNKEIDGFVIYNKSEKNKKHLRLYLKIMSAMLNLLIYQINLKNSLFLLKTKDFMNIMELIFEGFQEALVRNLINLKVLEGGSTISQQLARNILRDNRRTIYRKIKECFKAIKLENNFSKDEILNLYFDNVYF